MRQTSKLARVLAALSVLGAAALPAQEVRGRAFAPGSSQAVPGVIVTLVDSAGAVVDRMLTSGSGAFHLRGPAAGRYHLRALRIGFRPTVTPDFSLAAGQVVERPLELGDRAITLAAVEVAADRSCRVHPDSSSAAYAAWEEARKALASAVLTRDRRYTMEMVRFDRRLDRRGDAVLAETETEDRGPSIRPFVSVPLAQLDTSGYVQVQGEWTTYQAPDEEVLLSDQFAATHCLRLAESAAPDEVAVAFEPAGGRKLPDIRGTLTLDRSTGALRRLEFTFANVARAVERERAGGEIFFRQLPQGGWIVSRWILRFPLLERVVTVRPGSMSGSERRTESFELRGVNESGGEVTEIARGDSILWQVPRPLLTGWVRDGSGAPVAGAVVSVPMLDRQATTDSAGRFTMRGVRRGLRPMQVLTPLLDSLGLPAIERQADSRQSDEVTLVIPSRDALFGSACPLSQAGAGGNGFVRGTTRSVRGERVGGVKVVASWYQPTEISPGSDPALDPRNLGGTRTLETVSSGTGDYFLCGLRVDQPISLRMSVNGIPVGQASGRIRKEQRILLLDLTVQQ